MQKSLYNFEHFCSKKQKLRLKTTHSANNCHFTSCCKYWKQYFGNFPMIWNCYPAAIWHVSVQTSPSNARLEILMLIPFFGAMSQKFSGQDNLPHHALRCHQHCVFFEIEFAHQEFSGRTINETQVELSRPRQWRL